MPVTFASRETLSLLVHAAAKVGKSTLSSTAPPPICVLDAEGSWKFIKIRKVYWDPMQGPPPTYDGTWDACIITVTSWQQVQTTYQWLTQYQHNFVSVVLDSITEMQRRLKANLKGTDAMQIQDWGQLLVQMDATIRAFRDLAEQPNTIRCVVMVAETRESSGKWRPYMQGQISVSLPYMVDICGYLYTAMEMDENSQPTVKTWQLFIGTHPQFESGERVQGVLGDSVRNPNITEMMKTVYTEVNMMEVKSE